MRDGMDKSRLWGWAGAAGVLVFLILWLAMSFGFWSALILAVVVAVLVAILMSYGLNRDEPAELTSPPPAHAAGAGDSIAPTPAAVKPVAPVALAGSDAATTSAVPKTPAPKAPAAKAAAKPKAKKPAAKKAPAKKPAAKKAAADGRPEFLAAARAGGADDLKQILGIGPKLETLLNTMGVYHFDQIASWKKGEVEWMDGNLQGFKGRVTRDDWVGQAKTLAKGGATEFSKRVKKGDVY